MGLLEMSISGAVFILVVFLVRAVAVNYLPKRTFLVLWGIVLLRLLIPLRIPSEISVYSWMPQRIEEIGDFIDKNHADFAEPKQNGHNIEEAYSDSGIGNWQKQNEQAPFMRSQSRQNLDDQNQDMWEQDVQDTDDQERLGVRILKVVWAGGCVVCLLFFIFIYIKCRLNFSKSIPVDNDFCDEFLKAHKWGRSIQVRQSREIKAPLTYGLFHPVILMPESTDWENKKQLKYVFMHEYIHIRRFDVVTKMVLILAVSIHWFNPFVWLMYFLYNRDLELSCDEMVVHVFGESSKSEYARILIDMEERRRKPMPLCNGFSKNAMEERIVAIMKIKKRTMTAIVSAVVLVCTVAGVFTTSAEAANRQGTDIQESEEKNSGASDSSLASGNSGASDSSLVSGNSGVSDSSLVSENSGATDGSRGSGNSSAVGTIMHSLDSKKDTPNSGQAGSSNADGTEQFKITNISLNLSNDQADIICQAICEHMSSKYEGIYSFDHYDFTFCNEAVKGDQMSLDIDMSAKMTLIRNPKKSPFVKGMRQAIKEIKGAKKKKAARKIYKEYLKEVMPYYLEPDDAGFSYCVQIPIASIEGDEEFKFELYYRSNVDGELLGSFAQEGKFEDNFKEEEGMAYIKENL